MIHISNEKHVWSCNTWVVKYHGLNYGSRLVGKRASFATYKLRIYQYVRGMPYGPHVSRNRFMVDLRRHRRYVVWMWVLTHCKMCSGVRIDSRLIIYYYYCVSEWVCDVCIEDTPRAGIEATKNGRMAGRNDHIHTYAIFANLLTLWKLNQFAFKAYFA